MQTYGFGSILLELEMVKPFLLDLEISRSVLSDLLDRVESIREPVQNPPSNEIVSSAHEIDKGRPRGRRDRRKGSLCCLKDLVKLLLERAGLGERPVRFLLMAEDDIVEDGFRDAEETGDFRVDLATFGRDSVPLYIPTAAIR
jgi:hypothetical protein